MSAPSQAGQLRSSSRRAESRHVRAAGWFTGRAASTHALPPDQRRRDRVPLPRRSGLYVGRRLRGETLEDFLSLPLEGTKVWSRRALARDLDAAFPWVVWRGYRFGRPAITSPIADCLCFRRAPRPSGTCCWRRMRPCLPARRSPAPGPFDLVAEGQRRDRRAVQCGRAARVRCARRATRASILRHVVRATRRSPARTCAVRKDGAEALLLSPPASMTTTFPTRRRRSEIESRQPESLAVRPDHLPCLHADRKREAFGRDTNDGRAELEPAHLLALRIRRRGDHVVPRGAGAAARRQCSGCWPTRDRRHRHNVMTSRWRRGASAATARSFLQNAARPRLKRDRIRGSGVAPRC